MAQSFNIDVSVDDKETEFEEVTQEFLTDTAEEIRDALESRGFKGVCVLIGHTLTGDACSEDCGECCADEG